MMNRAFGCLVVVVLCYTESVLATDQGQYDKIIFGHARTHQVPVALVFAVIRAESAFDHQAVSHAGAQGLMQLMPATARRFGVSDSFNPSENIRGGTTYLAWLLKRFNGNVRYALAGYNAGEGRVDEFQGIPPFRETRDYVNKVMRFYRDYAGLAGLAGSAGLAKSGAPLPVKKMTTAQRQPTGKKALVAQRIYQKPALQKTGLIRRKPTTHKKPRMVANRARLTHPAGQSRSLVRVSQTDRMAQTRVRSVTLPSADGYTRIRSVMKTSGGHH